MPSSPNTSVSSTNNIVPNNAVPSNTVPNNTGANQTTVVSGGGGQKRTRSERVASVVAKPSLLGWFWRELRKDNKIFHLMLMLVAVLGICAVIGAWNPPLGFRHHTIVYRNIVCATPFSVPSPQGQREAEMRVRSELKHVFINDPQPLIQMRDELRNTVAVMVNAENFDSLSPSDKLEWMKFLRPAGDVPQNIESDPKAAFEAFQGAFKAAFPVFDDFNRSLNRAFVPMEKGLIRQLDFTSLEGNQQQILVYKEGDTYDLAEPVFLNAVLIEDGSKFLDSLTKEMKNKELAQFLFQRIRPNLGGAFKGTLREDIEATARLRQEAIEAIKPVRVEFLPGQTLPIETGTPIGFSGMNILKAEYAETMKARHIDEKMLRFTAVAVLLVILFVLGWAFIFRRERRKPKTARGTAVLLFFLFLTVVTGRFLQHCSTEIGQWELVPLLLFVQCIAIMYSWEFSVVLASILTVALVLPDGSGIGIPLVMIGTSVAVATQLGRLRSRTKLIIVGFTSGCIAFTLTLATGLLNNRITDTFLFWEAGANFFWPIIAAFIMTGLLPFIERPFGIVTDMSLLELVDVSHPLLQELIRRAPATYSHSMQVGTVAEAAADAIRARGLMTRVGAYFHDIGKIFKPEYFAENQGDSKNLHNMLEPRMSTLIIVAHVKDGVDLARQHRLPQPLIDLIEQHHGTSLVSFFYGRAARQSKESGHGDHIEEGSFRYPGPKPQSKEAGILMLADASESACRSFDGNSPGKIESMVRQITKSKLDDGQFDDCGMTLKELKIVENNIINSLIAIKHGRIRYPGQESIEAQGRLLDRERAIASSPPAPSQIDAARNAS